MRQPAFPDVAVRARGLARHLLDHRTLLRLARAAGSAALASALEDLGYWPAPSSREHAPASAAEGVQRCIDYEIAKRLAVLTRWLDDRVAGFAGLFELDLRDALRIRLRAPAVVANDPAAAPPRRSGPTPFDPRGAIAQAADLDALLRALVRMRSAYAAPLLNTRAQHGDDVAALEATLDRTWAIRASTGAARGGRALARWARDEIDLQNAWDAVSAGGGPFVPGGEHLLVGPHGAISSIADPATRRRRLAEVFEKTPLEGVFADPEQAPAELEARARAIRIANARRSARLDPVGAAAIVEVVLRLWAERANLRCIAWGIGAGVSYETITARLVATP